MTKLVIAYVLTCSPLLLALAAWARIYLGPRLPNALALLALGIVSANSFLAASTFLYYRFRPPSRFLPPWQDPETLQLGLLFLLAPVGIVLGAVAGAKGASKWLVCVIEIASVSLFLVGLMAGVSV